MRTVALGDVVTFGAGGTPARARAEYWTGSIPWITGADISESGKATARSFVTRQAVADSSAHVYEPSTVILVTRTSVGKVGVLDTSTAINQDLTAILPGSNVDGQYLRRFLQASAHILRRQSRGATIKGVTRVDVAGLQIPLVELPEQRRIAAILDHAEALRAKRRQVLTHVDALTRSIFYDMFSNESTEIRVDDGAINLRTGPFGSQLLHGEFVQEGVAVLGLDNVVANEFRWGERRFVTAAKYESLKRYTVRPGDVLISIMGTTGRCVVVPEGIPLAINTKHICAITPDQSQLLPSFLRAAFLWHPASRAHLRRQTKGSIMDGLNMGIIKSMPVPRVSLDLQQDFARRLRQVVDQHDRAQAARQTGDELFASLQARAFRGEL